MRASSEPSRVDCAFCAGRTRPMTRAASRTCLNAWCKYRLTRTAGPAARAGRACAPNPAGPRAEMTSAPRSAGSCLSPSVSASLRPFRLHNIVAKLVARPRRLGALGRSQRRRIVGCVGARSAGDNCGTMLTNFHMGGMDEMGLFCAPGRPSFPTPLAVADLFRSSSPRSQLTISPRTIVGLCAHR